MHVNCLHSPKMIRAVALATATWLAVGTLSAQAAPRRAVKKPVVTKRAGKATKPVVAPQASANKNTVSDYIVAVVNSVPVTNREVNQRAHDIAQQMAQEGGKPLAREALLNEALRDIILQKAAIQSVRDTTLSVTEDEFNSAEQRLAASRNLTPQEFRRRVMAERHMNEAEYRKDLTDQLLLNKMRETRIGMATEKVTDIEALRWLRENAGAQDMQVTENHARHILLRADDDATAQQAATKLTAVRKRITANKQDFAAAAREISQDGNAAQGGDLGWVGPGVFVPEFEEQVNALQPGQISQPFTSRFGVHLVQLLERRNTPMTSAQRLQAARGALQQQKAEEAMRKWESEVRAQAYIEMRRAPH